MKIRGFTSCAVAALSLDPMSDESILTKFKRGQGVARRLYRRTPSAVFKTTAWARSRCDDSCF